MVKNNIGEEQGYTILFHITHSEKVKMRKNVRMWDISSKYLQPKFSQERDYFGSLQISIPRFCV